MLTSRRDGNDGTIEVVSVAMMMMNDAIDHRRLNIKIMACTYDNSLIINTC